jgi:hypothetical protein
MKTITRRVLGAAVALAFAAPPVQAGAASTTTIAATGAFDKDPGGICPHQVGYDSYLPIVMSGNLTGCWYTHVDRSLDFGPPSGLYFEAGRELFVGRVNGGALGSFKASYVLESQWNPDITTGTEVWGGCQHQIVPGSGQAGLRGISGYLAFTDIVTDVISYQVKGFIRRP